MEHSLTTPLTEAVFCVGFGSEPPRPRWGVPGGKGKISSGKDRRGRGLEEGNEKRCAWAATRLRGLGVRQAKARRVPQPARQDRIKGEAAKRAACRQGRQQRSAPPPQRGKRCKGDHQAPRRAGRIRLSQRFFFLHWWITFGRIIGII